jgi:TATA-box binding protein (TBP) (component of TFIID and TFIIIB)
MDDNAMRVPVTAAAIVAKLDKMVYEPEQF